MIKNKCLFCGKIQTDKNMFKLEFSLEGFYCDVCKSTFELEDGAYSLKDICGTYNNKRYMVVFGTKYTTIYKLPDIKNDNEIYLMQIVSTINSLVDINPNNFQEKLKIILLFS